MSFVGINAFFDEFQNLVNDFPNFVDENEDEFIGNLQTAFNYAEKDNVLMTLGIQPTFPNTGYGYIEYDKKDEAPIKKVSHFNRKVS